MAATCWVPTPVLSTNPSSKLANICLINSNPIVTFSGSINVRNQGVLLSHTTKLSTKLQAGLTDIEPDLNEDPRDRWATNGVPPEDFEYGIYDDHHTFFETSEKGTFWGAVAEEYASMDPPTGFQGLISWLFLPAVAAGMYFNVPGEYLYIGAGLFTVIFCIIEMDKPDQPHNFEPQIYNMERGSRDKLIADYNTMDIWDFNEKYGDLWDFTLTKDDILKR
ncbi:photosynthetic NDH subunit of subcomplex B 5, chloroplastic [Beta vulgaris subsp. vulgaris]|uniref:photosynthetic NDH subunit of subcomplex B 5, chloroplastic n=1 Tax=Beta vulgaris subsp. vulgaris TaxID=3555 RepID=UPI002036E3D8|nr:photosynthetic NDH subunit of subcomplex B 5, chloroplastic [Beta vulgaris subsp. vulgaris]XP_010681717.2 photosynthetic NDH subunit of subcomplex B 5, chloroplastic [Beta vulgaris subsp. vulgaris]